MDFETCQKFIADSDDRMVELQSEHSPSHCITHPYNYFYYVTNFKTFNYRYYNTQTCRLDYGSKLDSRPFQLEVVYNKPTLSYESCPGFLTLYYNLKWLNPIENPTHIVLTNLSKTLSFFVRWGIVIRYNPGCSWHGSTFMIRRVEMSNTMQTMNNSQVISFPMIDFFVRIPATKAIYTINRLYIHYPLQNKYKIHRFDMDSYDISIEATCITKISVRIFEFLGISSNLQATVSMHTNLVLLQ